MKKNNFKVVINNTARLKRFEQKTRRKYSQGWKKDVFYTCLDANDANCIIHGLTHEQHDGIVYCPYCGEDIVEPQGHFKMGEKCKVA